MSARTRKLLAEAEQLPIADISEAAYQTWIEHTATGLGWALQFHVRRSQVKGRWVTNTSSPGVPDLWLCHPGHGALLVLEVKAERGAPSPEQLQWIASLQRVPGVRAYVVRPSQAPKVVGLLADPKPC